MTVGIFILAVLSIILGLIDILWGALLTGVGGLSWLSGLLSFQETVRAWGGNAFAAGIFGIIVGVVQILVGFGLLGRQTWAWWLAVISTALSLIHPIVGVLNGNPWGLFGLIIPGAIFYYLMKPAIRAEFVHSQGGSD